MLNLTGYKETEQIYTGNRTLVYRAIRFGDKPDGIANAYRQPVIIKVLRNPHPNFNELVQFRNQYTITKNLEHPGIVRPLALERYGNGYALVMPDRGAIALNDYWQKSDRSLSEFLKIAIQLADALHYLNQERIIHKDIKPANILIHPDTHKIKLIDFSISSLLPLEQPHPINPNVLEGTLAYISPEQTGRMNRGIDYRTDFYSLGVTFYELLTGILPFDRTDPMELVYCHIAQTPLSLHIFTDSRGNNYPEVLSEILLKLMAKNAEERYQSALGLKHDLNRCLQQLGTTGEIATFEIGQRDICSRFSIPEKLYGREIEVQTLLDAFERVASPPTPLGKGGGAEMMLVAGFSGIGKTAVVNEVHKPIVEKRGYFIKGKFDQFNRNIPFSAFVQAFRDLMGQLLSESDAELTKWKEKILQAVGENGQVLIDAIPGLERIIGKQPPVPELSGNAAQNRFNLLFQRFIAVFATSEHPLVMFLDDLQWADLGSLNLIEVLIAQSNTGYLLLLGAYRDNEVFRSHPLMLTLAELEKAEAAISTITLDPLAPEQVNQLVAETLSCGEDLARPLMELVYQKTQGNPFFTTQFLVGLYDDKLIVFNRNLGYWSCDLVRVQDAALTDNVVEFMAGRLQKLAPETQNLLKFAACIGNRFDLNTLAVICQGSEDAVAMDLWQALQEGVVLPTSEDYKFFQGWHEDEEKLEITGVGYRFLHDRVQQAAYTLIPEEQKKETHLQIGHLLLGSVPEQEREMQIFAIVNQFNIAIELIQEPGEKEQLAELNILAARKAKNATAYSAADEYITLALGGLKENAWEDRWEFTLETYVLAIEIALLNLQFEKMNRWVEGLFQHHLPISTRGKIYQFQIQGYLIRNEYGRAIDLMLEILPEFDLNLPGSADAADVQLALAATGSLYEEKEVGALIHLPPMTDPQKKAAMPIFSAILPAAFSANPNLFLLVVLKMVELSIQYGHSPFSAIAYPTYGIVLCGLLEKFELGYQFGQLGIKLQSQSELKEIEPKVLMIFNVFVRSWQEPLKNTLQPLLDVYKISLEIGDWEYICQGGVNHITNCFLVGKNLKYIENIGQEYYNFYLKKGIDVGVPYIQQVWQTSLDLMGEENEPGTLTGSVCNEVEILEIYEGGNNGSGLGHFYSTKSILCYFLEHYSDALESILEAEKYRDRIVSTVFIPAIAFYGSLARLSVYPAVAPSQQEELLNEVVQNQEKMLLWATHAPSNYQHKWELVEAEKNKVQGNLIAAMEMYDRAIAGAQKNEYIQEEALANELAAKFYLDWGKEKIARAYMTDAYYGYARWGAKAKTDRLETQYPNLLAPILQPQSAEFNGIDRFPNLNQTISATIQTQSSSTSLSETFDFMSVLKAAQAISSSIELNPLLAEISQIILTNSGAEKAVLLIPHERQWQVRAIAQLNSERTIKTQTQVEPLTVDSPVPIRLIQYVKNTQETVLINSAKTEMTGILSGYLLEKHPQSVLCLPLVNQGKLIAILYLEHLTTKDVFTSERQTILKFLCTQGAISLKNAQLYQQAQQALTDLQQAQLQLVQSEKMSALGNLVAGVAHEINNPTGFLQGNIEPAKEYVEDLFSLIDVYQSEYPQENQAIENKIEEIELEFMRSDLPELIESMNEGIARIKNISKSLRVFSRKDEEDKTKFKIEEGIDSTLLILKHRTKANQHRPEIKIIKNYADLAEVECFPGQLNQVFMNIIANAIDAFEEANEGKTYAEIKANPNCIMIRTSMVNETQVEIQIKDNGCGMSSETRERIFEQGFTTKEVGKGTGLGMAIAHQIITEKHGGSIACHSELGKGTTFIIDIPLQG